jgi:hypothetical protein
MSTRDEMPYKLVGSHLYTDNAVPLFLQYPYSGETPVQQVGEDSVKLEEELFCRSEDSFRAYMTKHAIFQNLEIHKGRQIKVNRC